MNNLNLFNLSERMIQSLLELWRNPLTFTSCGYSHFILTINALERRGLITHHYQKKPPYRLTKLGQMIVNFILEGNSNGGINHEN